MDFTALIKEFGIDKMAPEDQQAIFEDVFKTLQMRVSLRLSEELTAEQIKGLDEASKRSEQEGLDELNRVYPNYDKMYQEEIDKLKEEVKQL